MSTADRRWRLVARNTIEFNASAYSTPEDVERDLPRGCRINSWEHLPASADGDLPPAYRAEVSTGRWVASTFEPRYGMGGFVGRTQGRDEPMCLAEVLAEEGEAPFSVATGTALDGIAGMLDILRGYAEPDAELRARCLERLEARGYPRRASSTTTKATEPPKASPRKSAWERLLEEDFGDLLKGVE
ncbi:MAG: hypothetical protein KF764_03060 [Labilithrix sp.]|nr:hypothetical protein [Labilithrix sp.]